MHIDIDIWGTFSILQYALTLTHLYGTLCGLRISHVQTCVVATISINKTWNSWRAGQLLSIIHLLYQVALNISYPSPHLMYLISPWNSIGTIYYTMSWHLCGCSNSRKYIDKYVAFKINVHKIPAEKGCSLWDNIYQK